NIQRGGVCRTSQWGGCSRLHRERTAASPARAQRRRDKPGLTQSALAFDLYRLDHYVFVGTVLTVLGDFRDFFHDFVTFDDLAENWVFAGEPVGVGDGDEKLRSVGVGTRVGHRQLSRLVKTMWRALGFVFELVARTAKTAAHRVPALDHEAGNYPMENSPVVKGVSGLFVGSGMRPLALAFAQFDEVGDGLGGLLFKQAANDATLAGFEHGIGSGCAGHSLLEFLN